ncbi:MAG: DsbA family protein [Sphingobium sp.]
MNDKADDSRADRGSLLRAGRTLLGAIVSRTAPPTPGRRRRIAIGVAGVGIAGLAAAASGALEGLKAADVPAAERARIEAVVRDYILQHPEIIPEAIEKLRDRQAVKTIDDNRKALETPYAGAWDGAADSDVVLVEFFDYACGYCRAAAPDIAKLLAEDKQLKIVYRELPILGEESGQATRVALLAADSGKYPAFHKAMYDGTQGELNHSAILAAASKAGLDKAKVQTALAASGTPDEVMTNLGLARALSAQGTPLFVVGNEILHGDVGYDALKDAVAKTRAAKAAN